MEARLPGRMAGGGLAPGERLPPERVLASTLGVSRMTVRQALDALARRGLVDRGVGRGTFVRAARPELRLDGPLGLTAELAAPGLAAEGPGLGGAAEGPGASGVGARGRVPGGGGGGGRVARPAAALDRRRAARAGGLLAAH